MIFMSGKARGAQPCSTVLATSTASPRYGRSQQKRRFDFAAIDETNSHQPRKLVAVEDAVKVEPVGEFELKLKGIRRPLAAYNVVAAVSSNT
jgi:hypothetical protein